MKQIGLFFGSDTGNTEEIAKKTLECIKKNMPSEVPGVAFLSGGQSELEATANVVVNVSGRGDKDINTVAEIDGIKF